MVLVAAASGFFLMALGFELALARLVLYHLSHTASSFCPGYFLNRVSLYAWVDLDHDPFKD
jgi:hypothetical protein